MASRGDSNRDIEDPLGVKTDESGGFVRVTIVIPALKTKLGLRGRTAKNAVVDVKFSTMSVSMDCHMENSKTTYKFSAPKTKGEIIPADSKWTVDEGKVTLLLRKKNPSEQWNLSQGGIKDAT